MRKRFVVVLLAAAALGGGLAGLVSGAPSSRAATPGCQAAGSGLSCASIDTPAGGGVDMDVWKRTAASDTPIKVWSQSASDPAEDFIVVADASTLTPLYPGLADKVTWGPGTAQPVMIEYAPLGVASGFCVSVITSAEYSHAALRPCDVATVTNATFNQYQTFVVTAVPDADGAFFEFLNVLTGYELTDQHPGTAGSAVVSEPAPADGPVAGQLWEHNG